MITGSARICVAGMPMSQGSKSAFVRGGRAVVVESGGAKHKSWREAVRSEAQRFVERAEPPGFRILGADLPVVLVAEFYLPRPASITKRVTVPHKGLDLDKLLRSVNDAVKGVIITDDARIVRIVTSKLYATTERPTGVRLMFSEHSFDEWEI